MRTRTVGFLGLFVLVASSALGLVRPESGPLPDYDVRTTLKGVALGASQGRFQALRRGRAAPPEMSAAREEALQRLQDSASGELAVRWDTLTGMPSRLLRYEGPLTGPDWRDPAVIARSFLRNYGDLFAMESLAIDSYEEVRRFASRDGSLTFVLLEQWVDGNPVYQSDTRFAITADGEIASVSTGDPLASVSDMGLGPAIDPEMALAAAAAAVGVDISGPLGRINSASERVARFEQGPFLTQPTLEAVYFPMGETGVLGYKVLLDTPGYPAYYEIVVDGVSGELLYRHNLTAYAQTDGLVFLEHPIADGGAPQLVQYPDNEVLIDDRWPNGWNGWALNPGDPLMDQDRSIGNAVDAKDDWADDNETTIGQRARDLDGLAPYLFNSPWFNSWEAGGNPTNDRAFAVNQLFYFANLYHNEMYALGFDEASGNWQRDNFGRGGENNDWLYADSQNGYQVGQRNNANMATPADGLNPRAQFFLFNGPPRRDSTVDGDVVWHEFTHGLSNRLIGGGNSGGCLQGFQGGAMGEGWSDFYAMIKFEDDVMGEYATANTTSGIRSDPYGTYPTCHLYDGVDFCAPNTCAGFCDANPPCPILCQVHDEGQLWAATLWEMRENLRLAPFPDYAEVAATIVTDGMKLAGCQPTFLDARDGILLADRYAYNGIHQCVIWQSFADRMMGEGATTVDVNDTLPVGSPNVPPFCTTNGEVVLELDTYSCDDMMAVTVHDGNASGMLSVQLTTALSGDTEIVMAGGTPPTFTAPPIQVVEAPMAIVSDGILQVFDGDTITATYADAMPGGWVSAPTAQVSCGVDVVTELFAVGGCSDDNGAIWPEPLPAILDAGEVVDFQLTVLNQEPRELTNVVVTVSSSDPAVVPMDPVQTLIGSIPAHTGSGAFTFPIAAARFLPTGTVDLDFQISADGYTGSVAPLVHTVPVHSDYVITEDDTGVEDFEMGDGGYSHAPWPGTTADEWAYGSPCVVGNNAWYAGPASCTGDAQEQDSLLETSSINPLTPTRVAWYPIELHFSHRLSLGAGDEALFIFGEENWLNTFDISFGSLTTYTSADNQAAFFPLTIPFVPQATIGAGIETQKGLVGIFDFFTTAGANPSQEWAIDDVEVHFDAADAVAQAMTTGCVEGGYFGSLTGCTGATLSVYNAQRPDERQFSMDGRFFEAAPDWHLFDVEFPTPTSTGEVLVMLAQTNPGGAGHAGQMGVSGHSITNPANHDFGSVPCADIPVPVGPAAIVATGQPIQLAWTPFTESGPATAIVGYNVYRIDAETFPAAVSTIADYTANMPVGNTVGQASINEYVDTAPPIMNGNTDEYTYALQPLFRCDDSMMTTCPLGWVEGSFGGDEMTPGTPNLSRDSQVSDGGTPVDGTVTVSIPLSADFISYGAERLQGDVLVTFITANERGSLAFKVFRGTSPDPATMQEVSDWITALGGGTYEFRDDNVPSGALYYQVREFEASGNWGSRSAVIEVDAVGARSGRSVGRSRGGSLSTGSRGAVRGSGQRGGRSR